MSAIANTPLGSPLPALAAEQHARTKSKSIVLYGTFALLLFGPLAFGAVDPISVFVVESGSALLLLLWILGKIQKQELRITSNPVFLPICAFAALVAVQYMSGISSYRYATGSAALLYCAQGILCFLAIQSLQSTSQVKRLAVLFSVYGFAVASFAILQSASPSGKIYWLRTARGAWIYGPYVNHNHYAGLMELLTPIPLVLSVTRLASGRQKAMAAAAGAVMAASIFLSGSRGGMTAFVVQTSLLCVLVLRREAKNRNTALALGAFVVIVAGLLVWLGGSELANRMGSIHSEARTELTGGTRLTIDRDGIRMFFKKPVLGWGLATFPEVYPQFRSFYTDFFVNAAHNDYLQLLVETGLAGLAIMIWFLFSTYRGAIRKLSNWPSDTNGAVALAAMIGVTGLLAHSFVDFNLQIPANASLFYVLCAIAAMEPQFGRSKRRSRKVDPVAEMMLS